MQTIRTTITIPTSLHRQLRSKAFQNHQSLNQVIVDKLRDSPEKAYRAQSLDQKIAGNLEFFRKVGQTGEKIDWMKAIREERNR